MESESERLDRQIVEMAAAGKNEGETAKLLGCTRADVRLALDSYAAAVLSAQSRVRTIAVELAKLASYEEPFLKQAKAGDVHSGALCVKISERRATLMGLNAPLRIDPVQLAADAQPHPTSTQKLRAVLEDFWAQDKKRLRNGGEGYGPNSWQDIQDKEEMARRESVSSED